MCRIAQLLPQEEELSAEQVKSIIDQAAFYGIKQLVLTGGEPFLWPDLFEISRYSAMKGLITVVTTNGTLLDEAGLTSLCTAKINHLHFPSMGPKKHTTGLGARVCLKRR